MGRPSLTLGTFGSLRFYRTDGGWRVRTYVRDADGIRREVERRARTKIAAEQALKIALRDRASGYATEITPITKVRVLAEAWFSELSGRATNTVQLYRGRLDRQVIPSLGGLYVHELTPSLIDRHLRAVAAKHGPGTAKTCRSVLAGMCSFAVRCNALAINPVRDLTPISTKPKRSPRALTIAEARQLLAWSTYDDYAVEHDLPDLLAFLVASGCRIGEALGLTWDRVSLDAGTVLIDRQAIRVKGESVQLMPTKTDAAMRTLALPVWCVRILERRSLDVSTPEDGESSPPVFPSIRSGGIRDPRNTARDIRRTLNAAGFEWASAHVVGRKSVATWMDLAGLSSRAAADQLGHRRVSMTTDTYFGRRIEDTGAAAVLEAIGE
jgi:integrase